MASSPPPARAILRAAFLLALLLLAFYVGRPLYWKFSATVHEIREKRQTVKEGISQLVQEAQRSVGWFHDESDSGVVTDGADASPGVTSSRRLLGAG